MADPTVIVVQDILAPFAEVGVNDADFTFTALTASDGDAWVCTGRDILLVYNPEAGAKTLTIVSTDDEFGRAESITDYSLGAGEWAAFGVGLTNTKGWKDTAGKIKVIPEDATVDAAVLRLPAGFGR